MNPKPLLILEVDETLIHANVDIIHDGLSYKLPFHYVYERPYLKEFLIKANRLYTLAVWSSASEDYLLDILSRLLPKKIQLAVCWDRKQCTEQFDEKIGSLIYVKNLSKVKEKNFPLERTLIVDDSIEKVKLNYGNAIVIKPFEGNLSDSELLKLSSYLESIAAYPNYLQPDKRNWEKPIQ